MNTNGEQKDPRTIARQEFAHGNLKESLSIPRRLGTFQRGMTSSGWQGGASSLTSKGAADLELESGGGKRTASHSGGRRKNA